MTVINLSNVRMEIVEDSKAHANALAVLAEEGKVAGVFIAFLGQDGQAHALISDQDNMAGIFGAIELGKHELFRRMEDSE